MKMLPRADEIAALKKEILQLFRAYYYRSGDASYILKRMQVLMDQCEVKIEKEKKELSLF